MPNNNNKESTPATEQVNWLFGKDPLDELEWLYQTSRNPLFAWDAFVLARQTEKPVPEFVVEYLLQVAATLTSAPPLTPLDVAKCMQFSGDRDTAGNGPKLKAAQFAALGSHLNDDNPRDALRKVRGLIEMDDSAYASVARSVLSEMSRPLAIKWLMDLTGRTDDTVRNRLRGLGL